MADDKDTRTDQDNASGNPPQLPTILWADPDIHGGNVHTRAHNQGTVPPKWFQIPDWWVVIFTGALVFVGIATARLLLRQLGEVRAATSAATQAVTTAQKQLEATDRPWLKITFTAEGRGFYFREDGTAELTLRIHIKNIGHSVANGVIVTNEMFLPSDANGSFFKEPIEDQKKLCDAAANKTVGSPEDQRQQNEMLSMVIFPDDADESQTIGMSISKADIDARKNQVPEGPRLAKVPGGKRIVPYIVGCVDYEFGTSTHHHQTGFIYQVLRRIQVPPTIYPFVMIDITQQVAPSNVVLTKYGFGGFAAN